jgi:hypothetical protein
MNESLKTASDSAIPRGEKCLANPPCVAEKAIDAVTFPVSWESFPEPCLPGSPEVCG